VITSPAFQSGAFLYFITCDVKNVIFEIVIGIFVKKEKIKK